MSTGRHGYTAPWGLANAEGGFIQPTLPVSVSTIAGPHQSEPLPKVRVRSTKADMDAAAAMREEMNATYRRAQRKGHHPAAEVFAFMMTMGAFEVRDSRLIRLKSSRGRHPWRDVEPREVTGNLRIYLEGGKVSVCEVKICIVRAMLGRPLDAKVRVADRPDRFIVKEGGAAKNGGTRFTVAKGNRCNVG